MCRYRETYTAPTAQKEPFQKTSLLVRNICHHEDEDMTRAENDYNHLVEMTFESANRPERPTPNSCKPGVGVASHSATRPPGRADASANRPSIHRFYPLPAPEHHPPCQLLSDQ